MDFSKAKPSKGERVKRFFKSYAYYLVLGVAVLAIVIVAIVGATGTKPTNLNITDPPVEDVDGPPVVWGAPVTTIDILKGYDGTALQLNETFNVWEIHKAIDFKLNAGDSVFCVLDGTVKSISTNLLEGTVVTIEHDGGFVSSYGSLNETVNVKIGDKLKTGALIGTASVSAGDEESMGAHLHFELLQNGKKINPALYIDLGDK